MAVVVKINARIAKYPFIICNIFAIWVAMGFLMRIPVIAGNEIATMVIYGVPLFIGAMLSIVAAFEYGDTLAKIYDEDADGKDSKKTIKTGSDWFVNLVLASFFILVFVFTFIHLGSILFGLTANNSVFTTYYVELVKKFFTLHEFIPIICATVGGIVVLPLAIAPLLVIFGFLGKKRGKKKSKESNLIVTDNTD